MTFEIKFSSKIPKVLHMCERRGLAVKMCFLCPVVPLTTKALQLPPLCSLKYSTSSPRHPASRPLWSLPFSSSKSYSVEPGGAKLAFSLPVPPPPRPHPSPPPRPRPSDRWRRPSLFGHCSQLFSWPQELQSLTGGHCGPRLGQWNAGTWPKEFPIPE